MSPSQSWRSLSLESCMDAIIDYRGKTPRKTPTGVPLVTAKVVKKGRIQDAPREYIDPDEYDAWMRRGLPRPGDIVITTEAPLGEVAQLDGSRIALAQRLITMRPRPDTLHSDFLLYLLQGEDVQNELRARASGTTVLGIKQSELRKVSLLLPPVDEQRAIAGILRPLDLAIDNNARMNRTLEAMARALFRSWFVDFDPVRAKVEGRPTGLPPEVAALFPDRLVDSPLGEVPEGWEVGTLADVVVERRDVVQPSAIDPTTRYIGLEHVPRGSIALGDYGRAEDVDSGKARFNAGDILFGKLRPYFKKVGAPGFAGICSTDILVAKPKTQDWFAFALFHLSSQEVVDHADACSGGTRMPRVNWKDLVRYPIALPPEPLAAEHNASTAPLVSRIQANLSQAETLAQLRDTLLPKLLSGEVRVPPNDSEEAVPA